jgi:phage/conjugal plasmid C-4 type zinc finger TraR family protein
MQKEIDPTEDFVYNNEEEAEMGQIHALHINMNAVANVRNKLAKQAKEPSLTECEDCGEEIPQARREAVPGVKRCIACQNIIDKRKKVYGA